jgi:ribosomal protein S20
MIRKTSFTSKIKTEYKETLKEVSKENKIPQAQLLEEALEYLFKKYKKEIKK